MISKKDLQTIEKLKQNLKNAHRCPICGKEIKLGLESSVVNSMTDSEQNLFAHLHLHGNPLHAMLCYIDNDNRIRSVSGLKSVEISRDSETFAELVKKWSNPY